MKHPSAVSCLGALLPGETYTHIWSADGAERRIIYVTDQFLEGAESLRSFLQVTTWRRRNVHPVYG